uniref:Uncharacterized protein n=1 Tax=Fagus sylvatica TaxID=28930 RepID=A0A2N9HBB6_FAGSY
MEHVISIEEFHSRKVERKEAGETSRGHDQPVIVASATEKLNITVQEKGSNSSVEEKFKKLRRHNQTAESSDNKTKDTKGCVVLLRDHKNFKSYCEPRVVSLGPIHHDEKKYRLTEEYKLVLADDFIKKSGKRGEDLYEMVKKNIKQLREYYDEEVTEKYNDEALAWILTRKFDGVSILCFIDWESMLATWTNATTKKLKEMATNGEAIHLLDLLRKRLLADNPPKSSEKVTGQSCEDKSSENNQSAKKEEHSIHNAQEPNKGEKEINVCNSGWGICKKNQSSIKDAHLYRNVQELKAVGILLESNRSSCLGHIRFTKRWNVYSEILQLPQITVDDSTGPKFFNLIAYEMCPDFENDFGVTSYISFLDSLIDEAKDVMDLRKAGILRNFLGSDEEVAQLFNGLCTDLVQNTEIYDDVRSHIQDYYNKKWKTWISEGLHTHFSSPWTVMAFLAALFAILATGVQTVYSVLSYYK